MLAAFRVLELPETGGAVVVTPMVGATRGTTLTSKAIPFSVGPPGPTLIMWIVEVSSHRPLALHVLASNGSSVGKITDFPIAVRNL